MALEVYNINEENGIYYEMLQKSLPHMDLVVHVNPDDVPVGDGYLIETTENVVYEVYAQTKQSADDGCVFLLHHLGFRFWSPQLHHYPELEEAPYVNYIGESAWANKRMFLTYGHNKFEESGKDLADDFVDWAKLVGMWGSLVQVGHSWRSMRLVIDPDGTKYPNLFNGDTLNLSHPKAIDLIVENRVALLDKQRRRNPDHYMVSIEPVDGDTHSSNEIVAWANQVAAGVKEQRPDAWVSIYAYGGHRQPPTIQCAENLYVQVAIGFNRSDLSYEQIIEGWAAQGATVGIREYGSIQTWTRSYPQGGGVIVDKWVKDLPKFLSRGATSINVEYGANWMVQLLGTAALVNMANFGNFDEAYTVQELSDQVFGGANIAPLYEYWASGIQMNDFTWRKTFDYLVGVEDEHPNLDLLRDAIYIAYRRYLLGEPENQTNLMDLEEYGKIMWHVREQDIVHCYASARRLFNGNVKNRDYSLWMFNKIPCTWETDTKAISWEEVHEDHRLLKERTDIQKWPAPKAPRTKPTEKTPYIQSRTGMKVFMEAKTVYMINGSVVRVPKEGVYDVPKGLFAILTNTAAAILVHPEEPPFLEQVRGGNLWYIHQGGDLVADANPRITLYTANVKKRWDVTPRSRDIVLNATVIKDLDPQLMLVHGVNLMGSCSILSGPPWLQLNKDRLVTF